MSPESQAIDDMKVPQLTVACVRNLHTELNQDVAYNSRNAIIRGPIQRCVPDDWFKM